MNFILQKSAKSIIDKKDGEEQKKALQELGKVRHVQDMMAKNRDEMQAGQ